MPILHVDVILRLHADVRLDLSDPRRQGKRLTEVLEQVVRTLESFAVLQQFRQFADLPHSHARNTPDLPVAIAADADVSRLSNRADHFKAAQLEPPPLG